MVLLRMPIVLFGMFSHVFSVLVCVRTFSHVLVCFRIISCVGTLGPNHKNHLSSIRNTLRALKIVRIDGHRLRPRRGGPEAWGLSEPR